MHKHALLIGSIITCLTACGGSGSSGEQGKEPAGNGQNIQTQATITIHHASGNETINYGDSK